MEENISERNGFMRLICGVAMTAMGTAHLARDSKGLGFALIAAGAMKVAEGIFLYCPLTAAINSNVKDAVASSFDEFMDGDSLMKAFNENYQNKYGQNASQAGQNATNPS
ncbi:YgaP family membrane protein [Ureibacillus sp. MALMAid1270]|uniref:YgaP family membrane protein n=1 Tax=Ureibacillus sp. MALMAid1270 TaxID=3411629 RepID=UPI003BA6F436